MTNRKSIQLSVTLTVLSLSLVSGARGQQTPSFDSVMAVMRADIQANKTTIIGQAMGLNDRDSTLFWPIYRQYQFERSKLDDGRVEVIKEYTEKYPNLTDAEAAAMANRMFEYDSGIALLNRRYFKKFNRVLPALSVTKFFQLERRIDLMIDMKLEATLPPLAQAQYIDQP